MGAFYYATLEEFLSADPSQVLGKLTGNHQHNELQKKQIRAWTSEIKVLKAEGIKLVEAHAAATQWVLLLEYPIPRRQKRLDAVLLAEDVIFCLEFKTEDRTHSVQSQRQAEDYALDLRDFHKVSAGRHIVPIAIIPKAPSAISSKSQRPFDFVRDVRLANAADLAQVLLTSFREEHRSDTLPIDANDWNHSPYHPVPTIIEAAEAIFAGHNVCEIAHSHAGAENLTVTSECILALVQQAKNRREKIVCFVTGVPGAGKTLAGLNVAHSPALSPAGVFLSGNLPLVKIISAAIARDHKRQTGTADGERAVGTFIQSVQGFMCEGLEKTAPPVENVVVFDEAQRAWDAAHNQKKGKGEASEPEAMLSIMDRHDWAVLVALVGNGQEIHKGEAGLAEWGRAIREKLPHWKIATSPKTLSPISSNQQLFPDGKFGGLAIQQVPSLHLSVNLRSFRAKKISEWVNATLEGEPEKAAALMPELLDFPFALTRSLSRARSWLKHHCRGQQRSGLVASSGAIRLRSDGLELSSGFRQGNSNMFVDWFLALPPDVRSSNQLEIAASEFECQGLELDWVGMCWGNDVFFNPAENKWKFQTFRGTRWNNVKDETNRQYRLNTYRVLLTRARQGSIIWIPKGDQADQSRLPDCFDSTASYLQQCGLPLID